MRSASFTSVSAEALLGRYLRSPLFAPQRLPGAALISRTRRRQGNMTAITPRSSRL
jgi:hypothetical protein